MKTKFIEAIQSFVPFGERRRHNREIGALTMMYGDTLPDGGTMGAKLEFGNVETLRAVAGVITRVGQQEFIAEDLRLRGTVLHGVMKDRDPDDGAPNPLALFGEPARQVRETLESLADGMYPFIDDGAVEVAQVLDSQTPRRGTNPLAPRHGIAHDALTPAEQAFYQPNASYHEEITQKLHQHSGWADDSYNAFKEQ